MEEDLVVVVIASGSYKQPITEVLRQSKYKKTISTSELDASCADRRPWCPRAWVSKNSLRRLSACKMKVVYAVDTKEIDSRLYNQGKFFAYLFKRVSESVLVVSQSEKAWFHTGTTFPHKLLQPNLDDHIFAPQFGNVVNKLQSIEFIRDVKDLRAWRGEKVLLFGRTGSRKSTIAQMLTDGELNDHPKFQAGSGAKGETRQVQRCEGRGWYVTHTPGFGEPEGGPVPTTEAANRLKEFVTKVSGTYSHFIYVLRKDRLTKYDASLWQFFKAAFEGAETNFTVVVTNCDEGFPEADENRVRKTLTGCERFFHVSFPPLDLKDAMQEEENREVRQESLQRLEKNLSDAGIADPDCFEGILAEETVMSHPTLAPVGALGGIVQDLDTAAKQAGPVIGYVLETGIWMFKWHAKLAKAACHLTETLEVIMKSLLGEYRIHDDRIKMISLPQL